MCSSDLREPRILLGRESLALQGFPIDVLDEMGDSGKKDYLREPLLTDLAGNMVSTPVMLAAVMATMASVSWITAGPQQLEQTSGSEPDEEEDEDPDLDVMVDLFGAMEAANRKPGGMLQRVLAAPWASA